jgi:DNA-binding CsgD family transcriptional regulator
MLQAEPAESQIIDPSGAVTMKASIAANLPEGLEENILKSLRIPLAVIDNEFRYLWLNREMAGIYLSEPEQIRGKICYQFIRDQAGPCSDCPVAAVQKSGRRKISRKYKDFPDGVRKYGEISAFPIFGPQKKVAATLVMVIDVTDKIVGDMDVTYQMLGRLIPELQGWVQLSRPPLPSKEGHGSSRPVRTKNNNLTRRETQVLHLLAKGHSNPQIASRLGISTHTVKSHVIHIFNKMGVNDRIQAAVAATKRQIIE